MVMSRIQEASMIHAVYFHEIPTFCLPSLSQALSSSVIHTLLQSHSPLSLSDTHTFMQLECQWGTRSQSMQQCNSLTAVDPCQEETQMLQQQFISWLCSQLNYRKQSRFVTVRREDFYGVNIHRMHVINNKWFTFLLFQWNSKIYIYIYILFPNAALFAQLERLCLVNFNT